MTTELSPLKRALIALDQMQAKLDAAEQARREPIAIVGMACRFPGAANDPDAFWQLLVDGRDAVTEVPPERWDIDSLYDPDPDAPGKMSTRRAGFIDDVTGFDSLLFGVSPREATSMDPQQRLLLEVGWEALEHAGIAPDSLAGSRTGVFIGMTTSDYSVVQKEAVGIAGLDAYYATGIAHSIASGRLSYVLGLQGPSITIDTACSSSLVAVHLAVQSLRAGDSHLALAGGVNLILSPENSIVLSKFKMMAPDGRCKAFDAAADGFVRGEGCGIVALKRLSDALADGDRVLAVIRGSAVNQDGASGGLTAPNGPSQANVLRDALANGGVLARDVAYVEAHGTGTALGDPIEVQALAAVLGVDRAPDRPLAIGSVKTNVGHLEGVAGVAGLIKAVLVLQHGQIPPHLHLNELNPHIDWASMPIVVPTELTPLTTDGPRLAGVSAFGFSGTNAHVVVEAAPAAQPQVVDDRPLHLLTLSARSEPALRELAARHDAHLGAHPELSLRDVCATANAGRARLAHRLAVTATDGAELRDRLAGYVSGGRPAGVTIGEVVSTDPPRVAFLFTGQGSQWAGMAAGLHAREPAYRMSIERTAALFDAEFIATGVEPSLAQVLIAAPGSADAALLDQTQYTQAALFAVELALVDLWRSWGVTPAAMVGHSLGEIVAAVVAGVLSVEDGVRLVAARGRLMQALPSGGAMAAVHAPAGDVESVVAAAVAAGAVLAVAAVNGPQHSVVSGAAADVAALTARFADAGVTVKPLVVSHAFHSPLMTPMLDEFRRVAASLAFNPPRVRVISNVTGAAIGRELADPEYWVRHVLAPVRFADSIQALVSTGIDTFVEIGPHPVLSTMGQECAAPGWGTWAASLRRGQDDHRQMVTALAALHLAGVHIDWRGVEASHGARRVTLPTYPFERRPFWVQPSRRAVRRSSGGHPLLGAKLRSPLATITFESEISADSLAILGDHRVFGAAILPATAFIEIALAAGRTLMPDPGLDDVVIHEALVAPEDDVVTLQTIVTPDGSGASFRVYSQAPGGDTWATHVTGRLRPAAPGRQPPVPASIDDVQARATRVVEGADHQALMTERGLDFGPSLRNVRRIWIAPKHDVSNGCEALGEIVLSQREAAEAGSYVIHPALLDASMQVLADLVSSGSDTYLPISVDHVSTFATATATPPTWVWSHASLRGGTDLGGRPETIVADAVLVNSDGAVVVAVEGLRLKRTDATALRRLSRRRASEGWLHEIAWRPIDASSAAEHMPPSRHLASAGAAAIERLGAEHDIDRYHGLLVELDALSTDYIVAALQALGVSFSVGTQFDPAAMPVVAQQRRLFDELLSMLADDGLIAAVDGAWQVRRVPVTDISSARIERLAAQYPLGQGELALTTRCGEQLAGALTGTVDPLQLLFPGGSLDSAAQMYERSPFSHFYNSLAAETVAAAVAALPSGQRVRILEIGAGTGGTTAHVLPLLPAGRVDYTYTDVSPHFLVRARQKFAEFPFVEYRPLDVEGDMAGQGFAGQQFDIVVAANVLHATTDLGRTFANVAHVLAPGGALVMVEMVRRQRFIEITFGLTEGWWKFTDSDIRPEHLLLTGSAWQRVLDSNGFVDSQVAPADTAGESADAAAALTVQAVLVATRAAATEEGRCWVILADDVVGAELATDVQRRGGRAVVVTPGPTWLAVGGDRFELDPTDPAGFEQLVAAVGAAAIDEVVHLWSLEAPVGANARERAQRPLGSLLFLSRALANPGAGVHLAVVTRGAQPAGGVAPDAEQTLVWGAAKTIALEHPELGPRCIDLDPVAPIDTDVLLDALITAGAEDQIALRGGERFAARLVSPPQRSAVAPFELTCSDRGSLDGLVVRPAPRREPQAGEVEIRVHATGLNFKDVLNVLGMYPGDPGPLGGECSGIVVGIGADVTGLAVGDRVVALAPGAFRSHVTCAAHFVLPLPGSMSMVVGASVLTANVTAEFALFHRAGLRAGERVLIHAAAGGVGLAAVALALAAGAEIFATAGNDDKRAHLGALGVAHVYDSRSLDFAAQVMADTGGEGVDVVLNSLAGDFIGASLGLLRDGGRFLEIGKRDHLTDERAAVLGRGIVYDVIDWTESTRTEPQLIRSMMERALARAAAGSIAALPVQTFDIADAAGAFRFMAQARHTGKIVIVQPDAVYDRPRDIRPDGAYLVTGGLTGLGLLTAQHLASRGARHLALLGRRAPSHETLAAIEAMRADGVSVLVIAADVSERGDVVPALDAIRSAMPPLRGVFHSAGALDDASIGTMTWEQVTNVLAAKVDGALLLDELTRHDPLDHFVLYASIAALLGSPGQANHVAANVFLDALAERRVALSLPALSIDWGAWGEIGAAADLGVDKLVGERGIRVMTPADGLAVLDDLLDGMSPHVGVSPMDWPVLLRRSGSTAVPPYFTEAVVGTERRPVTPVPNTRAVDLAARLAGTAPERRQELLLGFVRDHAAHVLALPAAQVGDRTPLSDLGLDSLMAVELRNLLGAAVETTHPIPATLVFDYPTIEAITGFLASEVLGVTASESVAAAASAVPPDGVSNGTLVSSLLDDMDNLTDDEIDELLARRGGS
jgi:acyl transferase domain-containing protein/NADPH:quinone reductase-like Zn-dependent oxidoreductase/SAM-dependent methyltransferase